MATQNLVSNLPCANPLCPCGGACEHSQWSDGYAETPEGNAFRGVVNAIAIELFIGICALAAYAICKGYF